MAIKYPTVRELNSGLNFSARKQQEPEQDPAKVVKPPPLTAQENRIRAYEFIRQVETGSYSGDKRFTTRGDKGAARGDLQVWKSYYEDARDNPGRKKHSRPFFLSKYENIEKGEHVGAEVFAEYQRRWNEKGWIAGDLESIALTHNLGGPQYADLMKGKASQKVKDWATSYRKHLLSAKEGGRIPKDFFNDERWRIPVPKEAKAFTYTRNKKGQLIETTSGKQVLDWFSYKTIQSLDPKEASKYTMRLRDKASIWRWRE